LKNRGAVPISFTRPPSVIRAPKGMAAFAIGLKLLVPGSAGQSKAQDNGFSAVKDPDE
jgi:hypothetical protein